MVSTIPTEHLLALGALLACGGLLAGFLSGLLGIGGGGILVPILYEVFGAAGVPEDVRMHVTLGTTLAVVAPTVFRSFSAFRARASVDVDAVKRMAPWVVVGVIAGIVIAYYATSEVLRWIWIVFGSLLAVKMYLGRDDWKIAEKLPPPPKLEAAAGFIGLVSTLMGIGGATFTIPFFTLYGMPLLRAVGTATGIGSIIACLASRATSYRDGARPGCRRYRSAMSISAHSSSPRLRYWQRRWASMSRTAFPNARSNSRSPFS